MIGLAGQGSHPSPLGAMHHHSFVLGQLWADFAPTLGRLLANFRMTFD